MPQVLLSKKVMVSLVGILAVFVPTLRVWSGDGGELDETVSRRHVQPVRVGEMVARIREYSDRVPI